MLQPSLFNVFHKLCCLLLAWLHIASGAENCTVVLLGDSLINLPFKNHNLAGIMQKYVELPGSQDGTALPLVLINAGHNGEIIANTARRTKAEMDKYKPDAVIVFWDSDCSLVDETRHTTAEVTEMRLNFTRNLRTVLSTVKQSGALVAVAGPEILGEGPHGIPPSWNNKTVMLEAYKALVQEVAADLAVPYLDVREAFLHSLPSPITPHTLSFGGVTDDGEHPNARGTLIEAILFADQINKWALSGSFCRPHSGATIV